MQASTIEFQLQYEYANNMELFVEAMRKFLDSAADKDLGLKFEVKETMRGVEAYPTLTMNRTHLKDLLTGLKKALEQPLNKEILKGSRRAEWSVCM
jgi:hypothetical protein